MRALKPLAVVGVVASLATLLVCSDRRHDQDVVETRTAAITVAPPVGTFVVLAKHSISFDDRSTVTGGHLGVAASGTSTLNTLTAGFDSKIGLGFELLAPKVVLRDRAATGNVNATQIDAPNAQTGTRGPFVAPPPVPAPASVSPGTTAVSVPLGGSQTLAAGRFGAVTVAARGTLKLSGGTYQFQSLRLDDDTHFIALATSTVKIAGALSAGDRVQVATASGQLSGGLRIETSGTVTGSTNGVSFNNDPKLTAVFVAKRGFRAGDRLIGTGTIAAEDVVIGHDTKLGFDAATQLGGCTASSPDGTPCFDGNRCTQNDTCQAGVCVGGPPLSCDAPDACHQAGACDPATGRCSTPNAPNGTACNDGSACTTSDHCQAGVCVGSAVTCTALDSCHNPGVCSPATGQCSQPLKPGLTCSGIAVPAVTSPAPNTTGKMAGEIFGFNPFTGTVVVGPASDALLDRKGTIPIAAMTTVSESAFGDFNNDGGLDLVFANATARTLQIVRRIDPRAPLYDQAHIVTIDSAIPAGTPGPIVTRDVDGDKRVDLIMSFSTVANGAAVSTVYLYRNQNNGGTSFQRSQLPLTFPNGVLLAGKALADFNHDGRNDLAMFAANTGNATGTQIFVYPNSGNPSAPFSDSTRVAVPAVSSLMTSTGPNWGALTAVDLDGDRIPDLAALGNSGNLFGFRSLGAFSFGAGVQRGTVPNLAAMFDILFRDIVGNDGIPDLIVGNRVLSATAPDSPLRVFRGTSTGIATTPTSHAGYGTLAFQPPPTSFFPIVPASSTSQVGLIKQSPVVTSYIDGGGVEQASIWIQSVTAHLLEWTQATSWIDHGTPPTTIIDGQPEVAFENLAGGGLGRSVFIRGADGHLWELRQVSGDGVNPGTENWVNHGLPPASTGDFARAGAGVVAAVELKPSVIVNPSPSGNGGDFFQVFVVDSVGQLDRWDEEQGWSNLGTLGTNGTDNCFAQIGARGGSPKAISWFSDNGALNVDVFVTTALGDLLSWRDTQWEEPIGYYSTAHGVSPPTASGRSGDLPPDPARLTTTQFCPQPAGTAGFTPRVDRWPPRVGTPDALAFRDGGTLKRIVYTRTGEADIAEFSWVGDSGPVLMGPNKMYDGDAQARQRARTDNAYRILPKVSGTAFLKSDPVVIQGAAGELHLVALGVNDNINVFHGSTSTSPPTWTPTEDALVATETRLFSGNPGALLGPSGLVLFGTRWSGFLSSGADTGGGPFAPTDLPPVSPPSVRDNREAALSIPGSASRGCKKGGTPGEQTFPEWRGVELQRSLSDDQFNAIYTTPPNFDQGYESEKLGIVQGVVLGSHAAAIDTPWSHVFGPSNERPQVRHDWNIIVGPDIGSQFMLSDANIDAGGTMEMEWQQQENMQSLDSVPAIGDRVALRGRYIYDCGHPPYRTEIHAPDAMAVMHGSRGKLRFSRHGGPLWYQPADTNLRQPAQSCTDVQSLAKVLAGTTDSIAARDALWAAGTCIRNLGDQFQKIQPANMCYRDYEHSLTDVIGDEIPLEFDVPLPAGGSGTPSLVSPPGGGDFTAAFPGSTAQFLSDPAPHFHVVLPSSAFPPEANDGGRTLFFEATWSSMTPPPTRSFDVQVTLVPGRRHDNMTTDDVTAFTIEAIAYFKGITGISCTSDEDDEMVVYVTINDHLVRINPKNNTHDAVRVVLRNDETLTIGTHGYECDLSCGERWDDDFVEAPDDRIGTTKLAFTAAENFGANPNIGMPALYERVLSMPDLSTPRSRDLSALDYTIKVSITETSSIQGCTNVPADVVFPGPGAIDTTTTIGAGYGQPGCPSQFVAEMDLTQSQFQGHDVFVTGVWTPTVAGTPCNEAATMNVFGFDGFSWTPFDMVTFTGVANGNICRPHATHHDDPGSAGLDGTKIPANNFEKVRVVVAASQNNVPLPVFVSAENLP